MKLWHIMDNRKTYCCTNYVVVAETRGKAINKVAAHLLKEYGKVEGRKLKTSFLMEAAKKGKTFGDCSHIEVVESSIDGVVSIDQSE